LRQHTSPLLTSVETYAIKKQPNFGSISILQLLRDVDIPNFLQDIVQHPYFDKLSISIDILTKFNFWNSYLVQILTSQFAPEPRIAWIYAILGLINHKAKSPKAGKTPQANAVFYLPNDNNSFNHQDARLHGALLCILITT
jgi:hypothetical protein